MGKGSTIIVPAKTVNSPSQTTPEITIRATKELIINTVAQYYPDIVQQSTSDNLPIKRSLELLDSMIDMAYKKTSYLFPTPIHDDALKALTALKADLATKNIILTPADDLKKVGAKLISDLHPIRAAALEELPLHQPESKMKALTAIDSKSAPYFDELKPQLLMTFKTASLPASTEPTPTEQRYLDSYSSQVAEQKTALLAQFKSTPKKPYDIEALRAIEDRTDNGFVLNISNRETWSRDEKKHLENHVVSKAAAKRDKETLKAIGMRPAF